MQRLAWITRSPYALPAAAYAAVSVALWPLPVLGLLHYGSSAVIAGVAFFAAGLGAIAAFRRGEALGSVVGRHVALLAIPLLLLTLTLLWRPNCGYLTGLLLFGVFAVPSVILAVALAYMLTAGRLRRPAPWFLGIGVLVATVPVAYDLGLHPQLYSYNHVWGGILGTIYDEEPVIRDGLFYFRGLSLLWAATFVLLGVRARRRRSPGVEHRNRPLAAGLLASAVGIAAIYACAPWLGINTPAWYIQQRLGGHVAVDRFDIFYDPASLTEGQLLLIIDEHRFRYAQLREALGVDVAGRIQSYIYPDVETKAALTGSRIGGVAPTWLRTPQLHVVYERFHDIFAHELAHVMAREFGMPVIRASPAVGLIEGLAVAVEPPDGLPSVHAQVAAALRHREALGVYGESLVTAAAGQLRPFGFWTGRGAVSYTTMGSFVRYLLDTYGPSRVREAYRTGRLEQAFDKPLRELVAGWERYVRAYPEDPEALALVMVRFTRPSLFERRCPHYVPAVERHLRAGRAALARDDLAAAEAAFERALRAAPDHEGALAAWAGVQLGHGAVEAARERLERRAALLDTLAGRALLTRLGDARRLAGDDEGADQAYAAALERVPPFAHEMRALLALRAELPPETLRLLLAPAPRAARADALEDAPGGEPFAAFLWAEVGRFDRASRLMDRAARALPRAERFAWQAAFLHGAGNRALAATMAEYAAQAYERRGAHAAAKRQRDRAALLLWHGHRDTGALR